VATPPAVDLDLFVSTRTRGGNGSESDQVTFTMQASSFANSEWSSPENLAAINSTFNEQAPSLSPDGLGLYFGSKPAPGRWLDRYRPLGVPSELR